MASKLVTKMYIEKNMRIKKLISGEVMLHFNNQNLKNVTLSSNTELDLLSIQGVTIDELKNSNFERLIEQGRIAFV